MQIQQNKGNQNSIVARQRHNPHSPYQTKEGAKPVVLHGASVDLTIPQVKRILKNQIKRGKYQKK
jgi:hypothetical protein